MCSRDPPWKLTFRRRQQLSTRRRIYTLGKTIYDHPWPKMDAVICEEELRMKKTHQWCVWVQVCGVRALSETCIDRQFSALWRDAILNLRPLIFDIHRVSKCWNHVSFRSQGYSGPVARSKNRQWGWCLHDTVSIVDGLVAHSWTSTGCSKRRKNTSTRLRGSKIRALWML